jgi:hypothetical protein
MKWVHDRLIFNAAAVANGANVRDAIRPAVNKPRNAP